MYQVKASRLSSVAAGLILAFLLAAFLLSGCTSLALGVLEFAVTPTPVSRERCDACVKDGDVAP